MKDNVIEIIVSELRAANPKLLDVGVSTALIGREGVLDSIGLVNLIVSVEQRLHDEMGVVVVLADEKAMSQTRSPFRTVASLAEYICKLTNVDQAHE